MTIKHVSYCYVYNLLVQVLQHMYSHNSKTSYKEWIVVLGNVYTSHRFKMLWQMWHNFFFKIFFKFLGPVWSSFWFYFFFYIIFPLINWYTDFYEYHRRCSWKNISLLFWVVCTRGFSWSNQNKSKLSIYIILLNIFII